MINGFNNFFGGIELLHKRNDLVTNYLPIRFVKRTRHSIGTRCLEGLHLFDYSPNILGRGDRTHRFAHLQVNFVRHQLFQIRRYTRIRRFKDFLESLHQITSHMYYIPDKRVIPIFKSPKKVSFRTDNCRSVKEARICIAFFNPQLP